MPVTADPRAEAEELVHLPVPERAARFRLLPKDRAAAVFDAFDAPHQCELLDGLQSDQVRDLLEEMEPDDRARLIDELPATVARRLLDELSERERALTGTLLGFPPESAGRIMSPELVELEPGQTVSEALAAAREGADHAETIYVLPVRDAERRLLGVVGLADLVLADADRRVGDLVDAEHPRVSAYDDQEPVARLMQEANLLAVPVVDAEGRLLGLVTVDDAMEVLEAEETEDVSRIGGSEPLRAPYFSVPVRRLVRARIVWLLLLVAAASLTVTVLDAFEATLEEAVRLALFIPLLIGTGGNCGAQAATTMTRAIAVGDVRFGDTPASVLKELRVGLLLGLLFAAVALPAVSALFTFDLAVVVSLTLLAVCTWATTIGGLLPLVASRVGVDPAVVSAPLVTTLVDATGLVIYFLIADLVLL